jgi:hypothetical protein
MVKGNKATPEQWSEVEGESWNSPRCSCLMELRDRVEALEAAANVKRTTLEHDVQSGGAAAQRVFSKKKLKEKSLVELVAKAIIDSPSPDDSWRCEARAAIREVAAWLREQKGDFCLYNTGLTLDKETEQ